MFFTLRYFRKAARRVPILAALVWLGAACKADLPQQVALDSGTAKPCSVYADQLVAFNPAGGEGGSQFGTMALAAPDGEVVPLSTNGVLTVAFLGLGGIINEIGDDLEVHGTFDAGSAIAVYVGFGEGERSFSGSLSSTGNTVDFAMASPNAASYVVSYVELVGITGTATIDAFESLQTGCP